MLLLGCQDTEYSYDAWFAGRPNEAFTFAALKAFAGLAAAAKYKDWHKAIRKILLSQQYPRTPNQSGTSTMKGWKVLA